MTFAAYYYIIYINEKQKNRKGKNELHKRRKKEYLKKLRAEWTKAKELLTAEKISEIEAIVKTHGMNISATGFMFVSIQMKHLGFEGLPYLDAKTYKGWLENGFRVTKGEKSKMSGITWVNVNKNDDGSEGEENSDYVFPKQYHLFHRSQVQEVA